MVASITQMPLVGDDTRVFSRRGGLAVIGLAVLMILIVMLSQYDFGTWPVWSAIFVPYGVRRLEDAYRQGAEEGRLIAKARAAERQKAGTPQQPGD
ncbi:hypothetical protein EV643_11792 [Kribbella sp. VKM Ac-2527]|uniref:Uncharacterized protein n=1 Tax=Kribbella caucasensis TaxID=2512215 RepID=A0A4R6K4C5_9ACTN|nr:hypothetical protein [Kribbella sp. VKM Ac-2527]TDO44069.1 hypothetical protein EV643_11792 [Kribbella sp. VKM Ac-2527]